MGGFSYAETVYAIILISMIFNGIKEKIEKGRKKKVVETSVLHAQIIIVYFIMVVPIIFLLLSLYPLTVLTLIPQHPCTKYLGTNPSFSYLVPTTAYSSTVDQTDSTPFITADGSTVRWGIIATNFLPFNTCVQFPEMYGEQWFVVHDRKHERFSESIDIWHPTREQAKTYGFKVLKTKGWY